MARSASAAAPTELEKTVWVWTENRHVMTAAAAGRWAGRRGLHDCLAGWPHGWLAAVAVATMSAWLAGRWLSGRLPGRRGHGLSGRWLSGRLPGRRGHGLHVQLVHNNNKLFIHNHNKNTRARI
jgi:hypothetical protein